MPEEKAPKVGEIKSKFMVNCGRCLTTAKCYATNIRKADDVFRDDGWRIHDFYWYVCAGCVQAIIQEKKGVQSSPPVQEPKPI